MSGLAKQNRRKPGSQPALRRRNTQRVVETLAQRGPTTQANLARLTGLSTGTISNIVRDLTTDELITTTPVIDSGRRAMRIALRADSRVCMGADLSDGRMRLLLCRTDHEVLAEVDEPLEGESPTEQLRALRRLTDRELTRLGSSADQVVSVAIGLPAATLAPHHTDVPLSAWDNIDPQALAEVTFGFPCQFESASTLAALAQVSWGPYGTTGSLAHLSLGNEPSVGLIIDNEPLHGHAGSAGRIAHLAAQQPGDICRCGNRGCLQTVASSGAIVAAVGRAKRLHHVTDDQVVELARKRDLPTLRVLEDAGLAIGQALAAVCSIVNPTTVVVGGRMAEAGAPIVDPIHRAFVRRSLPVVAATTTITRCQLGDKAAVKGAAALVARAAVNTTAGALAG